MFSAVINCNDTDDVTVYSLATREAVLARYAQSHNDYNTWDYATRYGHLPVKTEHGWACGDFWAKDNQTGK